MSKYNEPWYATQPEQCGGWWVISKYSNGDDSVDESGDGGFEEETAKRIVACVNVCEGIPTVQLECGNVEFVNIFNERNALRQRVEELEHEKNQLLLQKEA